MLYNIDKRRCEICNIPCFERNNYFYGKRMTARDFQDEQCYFNEKRRLINRTVHGWGVVCGLDVKPTEDNKGVEVTPGLAIDCCGREILVCGDAGDRYVPLIPDEIPKEHECDQPQSKEEEKNGDTHIAICLEYDECKREVVNLPAIACDETEKHEFNRIRDSWKITPIRIPKEFTDEPSCQRTDEEKEQSLHRYLCEKIKEGCQQCPECPCIILAVVTVHKNGDVKEDDIETCNRRKLVYSNQLLFSQINCYHGDLPRVTGIELGYYEPISDLPSEQTANVPVPITGIHNQTIKWDDLIKNNGLKITFNKLMNHETINVHTFLIALITIKHPTRYRLLRYIPSNIEFSDDNDKKTTSATFLFEDKWIGDEMKDIDSSAITESHEGADFEIILKGSSIFSKEGKALDGSFSGEFPSGNGTQGTDFLSWFHVSPQTN